ncbi:MAG TPA: SRPBCC family protein [Vicinamibacterales bacterium]|nr:SRPBCC family protein [Vicinamibacterales bacterium]
MANGTARFRPTDTLAHALGWFSIAVGAAELAAPSQVARLIGAADTNSTRNTLRVFGARELVAGVAILARPDQARWLWSRVGGDAMDLAWLRQIMAREGADHRRVGMASAIAAGIAAVDVLAAQQLGRGGRRASGPARGVRVEQVVTINRSIDETYRFWRDFANFPQFMRHVQEVEVLDRRRSRWTAKAPAGMSIHWDAEIIQDRDAEWIAWRSLPGSQVTNSGSVRFAPAPGARGTEVRVQLEYQPPAGQVGRLIAMLFGEEPEQQIREDLRRFKQLMETGEIPRSDGPGLRRAAPPARHAAARRNDTEVIA